MIKIYITNLGKYNEGELVGEWVELPIDYEEEFPEVLERIGINGRYEEYFITDYETEAGLEIKIGEYDNIRDLNEVASELEVLDAEQREVASLLVENGVHSDFTDAICNIDSVNIYHDCNSMEDVAYRVIEETGGFGTSDTLLINYFDYKRFGRDLEIEGTFIEASFGYIEVMY